MVVSVKRTVLIFSFLLIQACGSNKPVPHISQDDGPRSTENIEDLLNLSAEMRAHGTYSESLARMLDEVATDESRHDSGTLSRIHAERARVHSHLLNVEKSRAAANLALLLAKDQGDKALLSDAYYVSLLTTIDAEIETANHYGNKALNIAIAAKHPDLVVQAYWGIGLLAESRDNPTDALRAFERAIRVAEESSTDSETYVESLFHAGTMSDQLGRFDNALDYYKRAEVAAVEAPIPRLIRFAPYHTGRVMHERFGDGDAAIAELKRTVQIMTAQGARDHFLYPITLQRLGDVYADLKHNDKKSHAIYKAAVRVATENNQEMFVQRAVERLNTESK